MATRLLLIDSDAEFVGELRLTLEPLGVVIELVADADAALQIAKIDPPAAAVVGQMGPRGPGYGVVSKLRRRIPTLPVLMILDPDEEESERLATHRGLSTAASAYLSRPCSVRALYDTLSAILPRPLARRTEDLSRIVGERLFPDRSLLSRPGIFNDDDVAALEAEADAAFASLVVGPAAAASLTGSIPGGAAADEFALDDDLIEAISVDMEADIEADVAALNRDMAGILDAREGGGPRPSFPSLPALPRLPTRPRPATGTHAALSTGDHPIHGAAADIVRSSASQPAISMASMGSQPEVSVGPASMSGLISPAPSSSLAALLAEGTDLPDAAGLSDTERDLRARVVELSQEVALLRGQADRGRADRRHAEAAEAAELTEARARNIELERKLADAEAQLGQRDRQLAEAQARAEAVEAESIEVRTDARSAEARIANLEAATEAAEARAEAAELAQRAAEVLARTTVTQAEAAEANREAALDALRAEHTEALAAAQAQAQTAREAADEELAAAVQGRTEALAAQRARLESQQAADKATAAGTHLEALQALENELVALRRENERLRADAEDAEVATEAAQAAAISARRAEHLAEIEALKAAHAQALAAQAETAAGALAKAEARHTADREAMRAEAVREADDAVADRNAHIVDLAGQLNALRAQTEADARALTALTEELQAAERAATEHERQLEALRTEHGQRIEHLNAEHAAAIAAVHAQHEPAGESAVEQRAQAAEAANTALSRRVAELEAEVESQKSVVQKARRAIEATRKLFDADLDPET